MHLHFLCSVSICALLASMCVRECFKYEAKQWVLFVNGCYLDSDNVAAFFLLLFDDETYFVFECNELSTNGQWLCDYPLFVASLQSSVIILLFCYLCYWNRNRPYYTFFLVFVVKKVNRGNILLTNNHKCNTTFVVVKCHKNY